MAFQKEFAGKAYLKIDLLVKTPLHRRSMEVRRSGLRAPGPVFLMIAKDCTERLSAVALSVGLIIPRGQCFSGHVVQASSPPKCLDRDCVGRRRTGIRHGHVYRSVREKQGSVVYRQRVLQTETSLRTVSLVFRGHDLLKIANIIPSKEPHFRFGKN